MEHSQFLIVSAARSKSSYLVNLLNSHPDVVCHSELFHQDRVMLKLAKQEHNIPLFDVKWRDSHIELFIDQVYQETARQHPAAKAIGSKLLLYAYQINRGLEPLLTLKPRVIYLYRHNKLAWYSSLKIAMQTKIWATTTASICQPQIKFEPHDYMAMVENQLCLEKMVVKILQDYGVDFLSFEHETLDNNQAIEKILSFLELPKAQLTSVTVQQNTANLLTRFTNPETVKKFMLEIGQNHYLC